MQMSTSFALWPCDMATCVSRAMQKHLSKALSEFSKRFELYSAAPHCSVFCFASDDCNDHSKHHINSKPITQKQEPNNPAIQQSCGCISANNISYFFHFFAQHNFIFQNSICTRALGSDLAMLSTHSGCLLLRRSFSHDPARIGSDKCSAKAASAPTSAAASVNPNSVCYLCTGIAREQKIIAI